MPRLPSPHRESFGQQKLPAALIDFSRAKGAEQEQAESAGNNASPLRSSSPATIVARRFWRPAVINGLLEGSRMNNHRCTPSLGKAHSERCAQGRARRDSENSGALPSSSPLVHPSILPHEFAEQRNCNLRRHSTEEPHLSVENKTSASLLRSTKLPRNSRAFLRHHAVNLSVNSSRACGSDKRDRF